MEFSNAFDVEGFAEYLSAKGLHEDVISSVVTNRVTAEIFVSLTEGDLKELAPAVGDRLCLRKTLEEARKVTALAYLIRVTSSSRRAKLLRVCANNHSQEMLQIRYLLDISTA